MWVLKLWGLFQAGGLGGGENDPDAGFSLRDTEERCLYRETSEKSRTDTEDEREMNESESDTDRHSRRY